MIATEKEISSVSSPTDDENTLARMESDMLAYDPDAKTYGSFKEFMADMEQENE